MSYCCFAVLGLPPSASKIEVKAAYRRLASRHHPDRNPRDPKAGARFVAIIRAYREALRRAMATDAIRRWEWQSLDTTDTEQPTPPQSTAADPSSNQLPIAANTNRESSNPTCRRRRRGTPSDRRFGWMLSEEYIGTKLSAKA